MSRRARLCICVLPGSSSLQCSFEAAPQAPRAARASAACASAMLAGDAFRPPPRCRARRSVRLLRARARSLELTRADRHAQRCAPWMPDCAALRSPSASASDWRTRRKVRLHGAGPFVCGMQTVARSSFRRCSRSMTPLCGSAPRVDTQPVAPHPFAAARDDGRSRARGARGARAHRPGSRPSVCARAAATTAAGPLDFRGERLLVGRAACAPPASMQREAAGREFVECVAESHRVRSTQTRLEVIPERGFDGTLPAARPLRASLPPAADRRVPPCRATARRHPRRGGRRPAAAPRATRARRAPARARARRLRGAPPPASCSARSACGRSSAAASACASCSPLERAQRLLFRQALAAVPPRSCCGRAVALDGQAGPTCASQGGAAGSRAARCARARPASSAAPRPGRD